MTRPLTLHWSHGTATVNSLAAALEPLVFRLADGRSVSPFHRAPWLDESGPALSPPLMNAIRGEWPCVPFGAPHVDELPPEWRMSSNIDGACEPDIADRPHGYGSNVLWELSSTTDEIQAVVEYPEDSIISWLKRTVRPVVGRAAVDISLTIQARRAGATSVGFHPTFRLPDRPGDFVVRPGAFAAGFTYPVVFEPGVSRIAPGARFARLDAIPLKSGGFGAFDRLPPSEHSEEAILLVGADGRIVIDDYAQRATWILTWNAARLPHIMLWMSCRGRRAAPWNGRNLCLGVEPICGAFDLGSAVSATTNPINRLGFPTSIALSPGQEWRAAMRLEARPLEAGALASDGA